ncbi:uncharacterized protein [Palaemon carinicauda]|uniref:uncharacterized protein n=1 Tax=Palaemon carinicauda TaxID=392227 RepID=UPI0035B59639
MEGIDLGFPVNPVQSPAESPQHAEILPGGSSPAGSHVTQEQSILFEEGTKAEAVLKSETGTTPEEELEVRGLPKRGNKSELCQCQSEALEKDGVEVQEFLQGLEVRQDSGVNQGHKVGECTEEPREEEGHLNLGDSASVIGMQSVASGRSQRSRPSSTGSRHVLLAASRARLAAQLRVMKEINAIEREEAALKSKREMEMKAIEREEAALKSKREMLGLEAELAGVEAEEKALRALKEEEKEITHIPRIREHKP